MKGRELTQPTFEAPKTDKSISVSLPQLRSSLIQSLPFQRSMTGSQKPGFASGSVPISCFQRWERSKSFLNIVSSSSWCLSRGCAQRPRRFSLSLKQANFPSAYHSLSLPDALAPVRRKGVVPSW